MQHDADVAVNDSGRDADIDMGDDEPPCDACACAEDIAGMSCVEGGAFLMGTDSEEHRLLILHEVYLSPFFLDQTEVTNSQYRDCVTVGACTLPSNVTSYDRSSYYDSEEFADYPIVWVDWNQAEAYCLWVGKRLPTEAEWEKAARGGCDRFGSPGCEDEYDANSFVWGSAEPSCHLANVFRDCLGDTSAVGSYLGDQSEYGVFDLAGNASEWVNDWYTPDYYLSSPRENPQGPTELAAQGRCDLGTCRVLRGGSFSATFHPEDGAVYLRLARPVTSADPFHSFRCASDIE